MKELFSAFGTGVFRPLMTLFAPGVVSILPWLIGLMQRFPSLYEIINNNRTESALSLSLLALMIGLLLEDFGGHFEAHVLDKNRNAQTKDEHSREWNQYLRVAFRCEPVGARYMRNILLRMKFELGMAGACLIAAFGFFETTLDWTTSVLLGITAAGLASILLLMARSSHYVLSQTRSLLLQGLILLGESPN
jgi:hypothetical protein